MEHGSYDACEYYRRALVVLAQRARDAGVVLTLENEPLRPLAMGHYCQHAEARQARDVYEKPSEPLPLARPGRWLDGEPGPGAVAAIAEDAPQHYGCPKCGSLHDRDWYCGD